MDEPLSSLTKDEFWDVARVLRPGITREEFDADWAEFQRLKAERAIRKPN